MLNIFIGFDPTRLFKKLNGYQAKIDKNLTLAAKYSAQLVQKQAKLNISRGSRSGTIYRRSKGKSHQASAAGEYPKTDLSGLIKSIEVDAGWHVARVGTYLEYGKSLEVKPPNQGGRPWLQRTRDENAAKIRQIYSDAMRDAQR